MKKLFTIFFLLPITVFSQPVVAKVSELVSTSGVGSIGQNAVAGRLRIMIAGTSNSGGTPATVSLSGTDQTWTEIGTAGGALNATTGIRVQAFRWAVTSANTNSTTVTYTGTQDGGWIIQYDITGADVSGTNGSNSIVQVVTATDNATIQPSITLSALLEKAIVLTGWINDVNPPAGTVESGWVETLDDGYNTPTTGAYSMYRNNTTDNTPSWTAAALSNWAGIAIEIKPARRRIITD